MSVSLSAKYINALRYNMPAQLIYTAAQEVSNVL